MPDRIHTPIVRVPREIPLTPLPAPPRPDYSVPYDTGGPGETAGSLLLFHPQFMQPTGYLILRIFYLAAPDCKTIHNG